MSLPLLLSLLSFTSTTGANGWLLPRSPSLGRQSVLAAAVWEPSHRSVSTTAANCCALEVNATAEVVGASGRIGSLFLSFCNNHQDYDRHKTTTIATPRGVCPGTLSSSTTNSDDEQHPIFVTTPATAWPRIWMTTPRERRSDLVWIGNGLLDRKEIFVESTVVIPHFGVLSWGAKATTNQNSPPTYVYGKHAEKVASFLTGRHGIQTEIVEDFQTVKYYAARKLVWATCMWLFCHGDGITLSNNAHEQSQPQPKLPLTVKQVHEARQKDLDRLVGELMPVLSKNLVDSHQSVEDRAAILAYLQQYSLSMPDSVPSLDLAMNELEDRNGIFLKYAADGGRGGDTEDNEQSYHKELLTQLVGADRVRALEKDGVTKEMNGDATIRNSGEGVNCLHVTQLLESQVSCFGRPSQYHHCNKEPNSILIVGGGILGSSIALSLARQHQQDEKDNKSIQITVIDPIPLGQTSPASWAWLNANQKTPWQYKWLNQLGMRTWRLDPALKHLPDWQGALVCFREDQDKPQVGCGYDVQGPLSKEQIQALDENADFPEGGHVYFFSGEGSVEPCGAVKEIQNEATRLGVDFQSNVHVMEIVRSEEGLVAGVKIQEGEDGASIRNTTAKLVIVAAGTGTARLCGLPMVSSPGRISFAEPKNGETKLSKILVDMVRESHLLQRRDGIFVAGGGALEVGGSEAGVRATEAAEGQLLLAKAAELVPKALQDSAFIRSEHAVRPMPQDGLPAVGYLEENLYVAVTHSGITLAPALGQLIAAEVKQGLELETLDNFRPTRFFRDEM